MKKSPLFLCLVLLLFLANSCNLDSLDFNKLSDDLNLNPEVVAPLATADITVWDLIHSANNNNDDVITKDPTTGLVKIVYKQDNLYTYNVRDFLDFPTQQSLSADNKALGEVSPSDVSVSRKVTLQEMTETLPGAVNNVAAFSGQTIIFQPYSFTGPTVIYGVNPFSDFTSVTLSKGTLEVKLENKLKIPITIEGILYDKTKQANIASVAFANIQPSSTSTQPFTLDGKQLSNQIEFRLTKFTTPGSNPGTVLIDLQDYFNMTFSMKDLKVSAGNLMVKAQTLDESKGIMSFSFPEADLKAFSTVLKKGTLTFKSTNTSNLTGSINITLPEIKKNGTPVTATIPLTGNSSSIDLAGANINFASDATKPYNQVPYTYTVQVNKSSTYIDYVSTQTIKMEVTLTNLDFKSISGDFGKQKINIAQGVFDMNVEMLDKINGSFKLTDPKLNLIIHNPIGAPATVNLDFSATNKKNESVALKPNPFNLPVPADINSGTKTETVTFNKSNSNIVNFIALPPTGKITYSGLVDFNSGTTPITAANPNFLDLDAPFSIDLAMDLPLQLQTKDLAFSDTTKITGSDYDKIETADLVLTATNGLPLDIDIQLAFVDTNTHKQIGVSTKSKILTSAQVNATDNSITPVKSTNTFTLTKTDLENLRKSNSIVFTGFVSSPSAGTSVATIWSTSKIALSVVIKSKVNL